MEERQAPNFANQNQINQINRNVGVGLNRSQLSMLAEESSSNNSNRTINSIDLIIEPDLLSQITSNSNSTNEVSSGFYPATVHSSDLPSMDSLEVSESSVNTDLTIF